MLGIVGLPLVNNLANVLCIGKDVVDQPTRVVFATHGFTGLGREYLRPKAFGIERICNLQTGLLLRGQLEDPSDQLCLYLVDRVSSIDDIGLGSPNSLRSLFEERFLECECNLQGCT